jgi:hypothetical protein
METETKSYLCESALVQKEWTKPLASGRRERSQCVSVMRRSEEAGPLHSEGLRNGSDDVRASVATAKHDRLSQQPVPRSFRRLLVVATWVPSAITWRKRSSHITGEVPPCLDAVYRVSLSYKVHPKGRGNAWAQRRRSQSPLHWGCQQSQSRPSHAARAERQNQIEQFRRNRDMGKVSRSIQATKWPAVASWAVTRSSLLRNILQRPAVGGIAVHPR